MDITIRRDQQLSNTLEERLLADLRTHQPQAENQSLAFAAYDERDYLLGGVSGSTSYGWLLVKVLWVDSPMRGQGLGARLMAAIETEAKEHGCHGAWLDTSSRTALPFYERLGYGVFGELRNEAGQVPESHARLFLRKILTPQTP